MNSDIGGCEVVLFINETRIVSLACVCVGTAEHEKLVEGKAREQAERDFSQ